MKRVTRRLEAILLAFVVILVSMGGTFTISQAKTPAVRFQAKAKTLKIGKSYQLKVKKAKGITIKKKTFSRSGKAVSVTKKGKVTAKKQGKATVSCKVKYRKKGSAKLYNKKITCKITVVSSGGDDQQEDDGMQGDDKAQASAVPATSVPNPDAMVSAQPGASDGPGVTEPSEQGTPTPGVTEPTGQGTPEPDVTEPAGQDTPNPNATEPAGQGTPGSDATEPSEQGTPGPDATEPSGQETPEPDPTPNLGNQEKSSDAFQLVHNMGLGINLGNTMEAYKEGGAKNPSDAETAWGQPITTQAMITGMRKAGFRSLRIPVGWSNMISSDGKYTIDPALLKRVEEIIQYAFQEDMYVIINIHWDGQWWGQFGDKDASVRDKAWARYEAFWTQISEYYKDYSDQLIFESANEELGGRLNDDWTNTKAETQTGVLSVDECYQMTNQINQKFVDIVRASGGNNASRYLLIAGYDTDIEKTCDGRYQMPEDTIEDHMMVSVHYYTPSSYCISEDPNNKDWYQATWGTESDIAAMQAQLAMMKRTFVNQRYPVVIGEYGVADTKITENEKPSFIRKEGRDLFFKTLCEYSIDNGMCPVLWNTDNVYNKNTCSMKNETEAADYLQLEKDAAAKEPYVPEEFSGEYRWSGTLKNSSYNQSVVQADSSSTFNVSGQNVGCLTLSGVDWDLYEKPVIKLTASGLSGSHDCKFATKCNNQNQYWPKIETADLYDKSWTFSDPVTIDLSGKNLSGKQNLYFCLGGSDFEGNFTITITEK